MDNMDNKEIYVAVFSSQDREFDECGYGYLPLFNPVFGVYEDLWDAISNVSKYLHEHDEYEILEDTGSSDGNGHTIGWSYTFRYEDKATGAFGLYELEILAEYIHKKSRP